MAGIAPQIKAIYPSEDRIVSVDMSSLISADVLLVGEPTVSGAAALVIENSQVNTVNLVINGDTVPAGKAVAFTVNPDSAATGNYNIVISCDTNSTPKQIVSCAIVLSVIDKPSHD